MRMSDSIINLAKALAQFNAEVGKISKDANNPMFRNNYATLDTIIDEVRPIAAKHGLSIIQMPGGTSEQVALKTIILHESGEWLESDEFTMNPQPQVIDKTTKEKAITPQSVGSAISYARRYSMLAFLSLNTGEDDDGSKASHGHNAQEPSYKQQAPQQPTDSVMSSKQFGLLKGKVKELALKHGYKEEEAIALLFGKPATWEQIQTLSGQQASKYIKKALELVAG